MRFHATVGDIDTLLAFVSCTAKIKKQGVLRITTTDFGIVLSGGDSDALQCHASIKMRSIFSDFRVESMNNNQVGFTLQLDVLERALRSTAAVERALIKLAKKSGLPMLSIEGDMFQGKDRVRVHIEQDVPIALLTPQQLALHVEPQSGDPDVFLLLPSLPTMRPVVDRLKNVADRVVIRGTMKNSLSLAVETDNSEVLVSYSNLEHPTMNNQETVIDPEAVAEVCVDIHHLCKIMLVAPLNPDRVVLCLGHHNSCVFHLLPNNQHQWLTFFVPVKEY